MPIITFIANDILIFHDTPYKAHRRGARRAERPSWPQAHFQDVEEAASVKAKISIGTMLKFPRLFRYYPFSSDYRHSARRCHLGLATPP